MALGAADLQLLLNLRQDGIIGSPGAVMEIGAQQLANSFRRDRAGLSAMAALFGIDEPPPFTLLADAAETSSDGRTYETLAPDAPRSRLFWEWLGWRYEAIDIDGTPDAMPLDLNDGNVPASARGRFDLVVNAGTTEHVANQVNAFAVIHDLAAPGAVMLHNVPAQGMMEHGLVNYNPKFFWKLARSNDYRCVSIELITDGRGYPIEEAIAAELRLAMAPLICDASLLVALQKRFDTPFVLPLDVDNGVPPPTEALRQKYWSVFESGAWDRVAAEHERRSAAKGMRWLHPGRPGRRREFAIGLSHIVRALSPQMGIWTAVRQLFTSR
jgi:hypothetical protein